MTTLATRLTLALRQSGKTQAELARACGVKPPSVAAWFSGDTKKLKADSLIRAATFLGVRQEWLNSGQLPMHGGETVATTVLVAMEEPPASKLTSQEVDLVLAFRDLPKHKQKEFVAAVMKEADVWRSYTTELLSKHGVTRIVGDAHVAKHLPPAPANEEETRPGLLDENPRSPTSSSY